MGIYINMDIPEKCGLCPCFHAETPMYCQAVKADKNKKIVAPYGLPRPSWCPLVDIPNDHGRLIDADAFIAFMEKGKDDEAALDELIFQICKGGIEKMPTIIEAQKGIK